MAAEDSCHFQTGHHDAARSGVWHNVSALLIEGDLAPLMPLLAIGETCHAGSHASLGPGRYRLRIPDAG